MKSLLIVFVVISARFSEVFSIHCFNCNSVEDPRCGLPFRPFPQGIVDCDHEVYEKNVTVKATMCRKIHQTVYGEVRVTRSCGFLNHNEEHKRNRCMRSKYVEATETIYCDCDEDLCNGAVHLFTRCALVLIFGFLVTRLFQ